MDTEQIGPAEITADMLGCESEMSVIGTRVEHRRSEKTSGPKTGTSFGYGAKSLDSAVKHIGAARTLDMDVDETRGDYSALGVERVLARVARSDPDDDTVFNQNAVAPLLSRGVEQSTIGYKQSLRHFDPERTRIMDRKSDCKTLLAELIILSSPTKQRPRRQQTTASHRRRLAVCKKPLPWRFALEKTQGSLRLLTIPPRGFTISPASSSHLRAGLT
jgi:hypothetical protein